MLKRLAAVFCCAMLFAVFPAGADQWNKKTTVTFSGPVKLPSITLSAGTHVFKLARFKLSCKSSMLTSSYIHKSAANHKRRTTIR